MKKIFTLLIAFFLLVNCQAAKKERLELNLTKGKSYKQKMASITTINKPIQGKMTTIGMSISATMTYKVTGIKNSVYDMEVSYDSMSVKVLLPHNILEFTTWKSDTYSKILSSMLNKPFEIKMTKYGKVIDVNTDNLFSHMFDAFPELSKTKKQEIENFMKSGFGGEKLRKSMEQVSSFYPGHPVSTGSEWVSKRKIDVHAVAIKTKTRYQLKAIGNSYYLISGISEIKSGKNYLRNGNMRLPMKIALTGKTISEIKIDKRSGWIIDATVNQSLKEKFLINPKLNVPKDLHIPITIRNEVRITE